MFSAQPSRVSQTRGKCSPPQHSRAKTYKAPSLSNQAIQRLLRSGFIQPKLTVNQPGDRFEQEADRVANQVMRMPAGLTTEKTKRPWLGASVTKETKECPSLQRLCTECEKEKKRPSPEPYVVSLVTTGDALPLQPAEDEDRENVIVQAKTKPNLSPGIPVSLESRPPIPNGSGQPLPNAVRGFFEPRFGRDFSKVQIHTDRSAADSAEALNARAYTIGRHIAFGKGQYAPETTDGKRLLAHELVHTVQQGQANHSVNVQRTCGPTNIAALGPRIGCTDNFDGTFVAGSLFKFNMNCDDFAPGQEAALVSFVSGLSASTTFEIHGFASVDGSVDFNQNLGRARALKAQSALTSAGIAGARITGVVNHGPVPGPAVDRRSVVIRMTASPSPPPVPLAPLAVTFTRVRATTSPAGMPDRIPPRVDTIAGVGITGFLAPMLPITLSLEGAGGGNGTATINGAATVDLVASASVRLRGVDQTDVGRAGNLRLVANQGGTRLAASNNFSVSSIPQNHTMAFNSLVTGASRGMVVRHTWESDSGTVRDLNQTDISERVQINSQGGSLSSIALTTSGYLGIGTTAFLDTHRVAALSSAGFLTLNQTQMFKDNRTGAVDIPVTNSGYRIGHFILPIPGTGVLGFFRDFEITSMKFGMTTTALGISSSAGAGSETRTQRV